MDNFGDLVVLKANYFWKFHSFRNLFILEV